MCAATNSAIRLQSSTAFYKDSSSARPSSDGTTEATYMLLFRMALMPGSLGQGPAIN